MNDKTNSDERSDDDTTDEELDPELARLRKVRSTLGRVS